MWYIYSGFDWESLRRSLTEEMMWGWMIASLPFGVVAQMLRALRWKQALLPLGEKARVHTSICAIFLSYASSLVVPRVGEVLRCGVLKRYDNVDFSHGVGTVVTERVVDMVVMLLITAFTVLWQASTFMNFVQQTGMSVKGIVDHFSSTQFVLLCVGALVLGIIAVWGIHKMKFFSRLREVLSGITSGLLSVRKVQSPSLYAIYSIGIWVCYFLHFYVALLCFPATANVGVAAALVAFVVGSFAVLVPTPNGAGPWHFAVMTVFALYGVAANDGAVCALVTHTIQTALVALLGLYAMLALNFTRHRPRPLPQNERRDRSDRDRAPLPQPFPQMGGERG